METSFGIFVTDERFGNGNNDPATLEQLKQLLKDKPPATYIQIDMENRASTWSYGFLWLPGANKYVFTKSTGVGGAPETQANSLSPEEVYEMIKKIKAHPSYILKPIEVRSAGLPPTGGRRSSRRRRNRRRRSTRRARRN